MVSLVGRRSELTQFTTLLDRAAGGDGSIVAMTGDAGMGKSRLAFECLAIARARQFVVLRGVACPYQGDVSYAPVLEALRPLVYSTDRAWLAGVLEGLTDLGRLFDGLPLPPAISLGDPRLERTRLLEAVSQLVRRVADRQPVALLIDDLHWADTGSLDVLQHLARGVSGHRCLILLAYRPNEAGDVLRAFLTSLRREAQFFELPIAGLDPEEVSEFVTSLLGEAAPAPLLDALHYRARGVPLFVTALISSLVDSGRLFRSGGRWVLGPGAAGGLPPDVADLLLARLEGLSAPDRAVLEAVSVCGDAATYTVVHAVCGGEGDIPGGLRRLQAAGLVIEEIAGSAIVYRTSHPLLAEAAYGHLPVLLRQRYHAAAAGAVERGRPADISRLAHHVGRAGEQVDPVHALDVLIAAADQALQRRAGAEGVVHAEAALILARESSRDDLVPRLLDQLAEAATYSGRPQMAMAARREALAYLDDPVARSRCLRQLAVVEWDDGKFAEAMEDLDYAITGLMSLGQRPDALDERVHVTEARLVMHLRSHATDEVRADLGELERLAVGGAHPRAAALAYLAQFELEPLVDDVSTLEHYSAAAIEAAQEAGDAELVARLQTTRIIAALNRGDHVEARRCADESLRMVRPLGAPALEVGPTVLAGYAHFLAGAWDAALSAGDEALVRAHRVGMNRGIAQALAMRALVLTQRGALADAEACIAEARNVYGEDDRHMSDTVDIVYASIALAQGDPVRAAALADATKRATSGDVRISQVRGVAHRAAGDLAAVLRVADELAAQRSRYATAVADRLRALATARDDPHLSGQVLARAADAFDDLQIPFDAAVCRLDLAEALVDEDPVAAAAAAERSLIAFDELDARPDSDRARRLLRRLGHRPPPRSRRQEALSGREAEVARLVAQGMSNAAVARRLFISPRTVTTHLDRIYRRLQLRSRSDLARYVRDHLLDTHLAPPDYVPLPIPHSTQWSPSSD